ncbi:unnamed protein product, partial [Polarella glacialis]
LLHAPESLGSVLGELLKGHRVKTKAVEEAVVSGMAGTEDRYGVLREMLFMVFPKSPHSDWGWSRVGWSWQEWWKILEKTMSTIDSVSAFDELSLLLERIEASGGKPLAQQGQVWSEVRLSKVRALLCKLGGVEDENDLSACLDVTIR